MRRRLSRALLAGAGTHRSGSQRRGTGDGDLRQFPARRSPRGAARLHRRSGGDQARSPLRGGSAPGGVGVLRAALRHRGRPARHLHRDRLGRGGVEPGWPGLLVRTRGACSLWRGAAAAGGADPLGGRRDGDGLVRLHGGGRALRRPGGRGGARCGRMAAVSVFQSVDDAVAFAGAARIAEVVRAREVSPSELVDLYLERVARIEPELNAFRVVLAEQARADAKRAEARLASGNEAPLLGVPVAIKDNVDYAGEVTTHGTAAYGEPATEDGLVVRKLREAGATILGKTNLPELAFYGFTESPTWGDTRNPWDPSRTCGGSSGGSGVAVAAGMSAIAHGSDGAGSIRYPAAYCGLFGLKPQRNRVSLWPDREHWHGLSVSGCVSRTVMDTALYLDVMSGAEKGDFDSPPPLERPLVEAARTSPGKLQIACTTKTVLPIPKADEVITGYRETIDLLRSLGHEVTEA